MHKDFLNKQVAIYLRQPVWVIDREEPTTVLAGHITFSGVHGSFIVVEGKILIPHDNIAAIFIIDDKEAT